MAKREWLCCDDTNWFDLINIIKLENNCNERLREFHDILKREEATIKDIIETWCVVDKSSIKDYVNDWLYSDDLEDAAALGSLTYWFFNIYTGEALHIKCSVNISCSDIITD